jgi:hypothetical protein
VKELTRAQVLAGIATVVVAGAIAAGIFVAGSPEEERSRRLDSRRADDLSDIARRVDLFWTRNGRVPATLDDLAQVDGAKISAADPVTKQPYEYRPMGDRFELCAVFEEPSDHRGTFWSHGSGRQCFNREAQKVR